MKLDAHQHFWKYDPDDYGWINEAMSVLRKDYLPQMLRHESAKMSIEGSIAVQARQTLEENDFLIGLAQNNSDIVKGVVGWVDLCSPDVERQLDTYSQYNELKGIRHIVQDEPDDDFILRQDFQDGISKLRPYDLTYDILTFPRHLTRAIRLVDKFPDQKFVLDHISKPDIKSGSLGSWKDHIRFLATNKNVYCKLSGMATEADWDSWQEEDFYPYLEVVFDAFGADRLMVGSDWPVCLLAGSYTSVMNIVINYVNSNDPASLPLIMGENCASFYGVK